KAQVLIVQQQFPAAHAELETYLRQRPSDKDAARLVELCKNPRPADPGNIAALGEVLFRQKAFSLAERLETDRDKLFALYRKRIEAAWPGRGDRLWREKDGTLGLAIGSWTKDLTPIQGLPLTTLILDEWQGTDLSAVKGMPLSSLILTRSVNPNVVHQVRDL